MPRPPSTRQYLRLAPEFHGRPWGDYTPTFEVNIELLRDAAEARGLAFERLSARASRMSDGEMSVLFARRMPEATSVAAREITADKDLTKQFLEAAGLPVPIGRVFRKNQSTEARRFAEQLGVCVVKPLRGSGGHGISTNVTARGSFDAAWAAAHRVGTGRGRVTIERHIEGYDHRLYVLDGQVVAGLRRDPAYVVGDGRSSIEELIMEKNLVRSENPYTAAKLIELNDVVRNRLQSVGLEQTTVLEAGQHLQLIGVSNVGSGGEAQDLGESIHEGFCEMAVAAAAAIPGLYVAGIDLLAKDITAPPRSQDWAICEVNSNPDLALHHMPSGGTPRDVTGVLVARLFES